ncbi:MAG: SGNH/GDSL hydrolase family protein [Bacilli bacterium]|nr:SGNH/GDSL hydrolase family protein [Bacilli bacterium]
MKLTPCQNPEILTFLLFLKIIFKILFIMLPIIIIYNGVSNVVKAVIGSEDIKKYLPNMLKSLVAALLVFVLPSFIIFLFDNLLGEKFSSSSIVICFDNANKDSIKLFRDARALQDEEEKKAVLEALSRAGKERKDKDLAYARALEKVRKEKEAKQQQQQQSSTSYGTSPSSSTTPSSVPAGTVTIHVGDSRTVGMCAAITGSYNGCTFNSSGAKVHGNDIFIAQGSMGYSWFASSAVPAINNLITQYPNTTFNIISYMGVNFLLSDIDKYIVKYNELARTSWKNQNIVLVSVNPVNEAIEAQHGYSTKNSNIIEFNTRLKNGISATNIKYCDVYNTIKSSFKTQDGLHYDSGTYTAIFGKAKTCL